MLGQCFASASWRARRAPDRAVSPHLANGLHEANSSRLHLHDLVWSTSMTEIARQFGVRDRYIAKAVQLLAGQLPTATDRYLRGRTKAAASSAAGRSHIFEPNRRVKKPAAGRRWQRARFESGAGGGAPLCNIGIASRRSRWPTTHHTERLGYCNAQFSCCIAK